MKRIILIVLLVFVAEVSFAADFYVDLSGNDANPGTKEAPLQTIQKAVDIAVNPEDVVTVNDGVYSRGFIAEKHSGTPEKPIIIKSANRGKVTIDTSEIVTGWNQEGLPANTYRSEPVKGESDLLWMEGKTTLLHKKESQDAVKEDQDYFFDAKEKRFVLYSKKDAAKNIYHALGPSGIIVRGVSNIIVDGFVVQYAYVPILVGFSSPAIPGSGTDNILIDYCSAQYASHWGIAASTAITRKTSHVTFSHENVQYVDGGNGHCVKFAANLDADGGTYGKVVDSTIHDCQSVGIQFSNGWAFGEFTGNRVYNYGLKGVGQGAGIRCGSSGSDQSGCVIEKNDVGGGADGKGNSIGSSVYIQEDAKHIRVLNNKLHNNDWHGIYIFSVGKSYPSDVQIQNNLIYNNDKFGINVEKSTAVEILNNSFYNNGEKFHGTGAALALFQNAAGVVFVNNAVSSLDAPAIRMMEGAAYSGSNNVLYSKSGPTAVLSQKPYQLKDFTAKTGQEENSITADPLFVHPDKGDFHLQRSSTAVGKGKVLADKAVMDLDEKIRGDSWDIGAYEEK